MSDKPVAMLVTALILTPICSVCVLGPAVVVSWISGWFMGLSPAATALLAVVAVALILGFKRWRQARRGLDRPRRVMASSTTLTGRPGYTTPSPSGVAPPGAGSNGEIGGAVSRTG